ncbi:1-acyl-sn-glycerol-3-phosphate acyltransferase 3 isoform X2 [Populus trichocarpa]|uniref:1-acyl-sn-glycerol-3-phosphate acyltransferase 3 isoform X2 n=1 Tax=Populus trichocarpa TaxID=3694 RepID=UPI000D189DD3|nr:1-acyl-sn-glycerol-3-phosphate acyltransferase 3 isoform X2 [Populus trichocarpa]|eukprot:XP_024464151.1 1-acyl-sn-glycerol-3-phosphate acyltransferase 3 isoform X2 [Populus trichocarpa]
MAWPAVLVIVPVGIIFILSGLIVNLIQAVLFILVRPVSKSLHRRINKIVAELLWLELIVLVDWWANLKIEVYADDETFELLGKEHALVISNHNSDLDWLVGWILAQRSGCLGSALAVMKKEAKVLPIIGWSMWFSDYVFLERSWGKDERILQSGFERLADFPMPFWLALFVEGTRFTQAKLLAAQEFAASRGIPVPRNVLIPRTKGFVSAVTHLRSFVPAIYDATVAVANSQPAPTFLRIFRGQSSVIKVLLERHSMQELPETADGIAQWCKDAFVTKVMIFWSSLLAYATVRLFQWLSLFLASWEVITFSIAFLFLVTIIMQILIQSSESERSTPATNFTLSEGTRQRLLPR